MGAFFAWAQTLKFKSLFYLTLLIFIADLAVPDFIPLIDEILLGLFTLLLGSWKKKPKADEPPQIDG